MRIGGANAWVLGSWFDWYRTAVLVHYLARPWILVRSTRSRARNGALCAADSGPEQEELLHFVLNHLQEHHAAEYRFGEDTVEVLATGDVYRISDFIGQRDHLGNPKAMLLATLLVQEEFYILRREGTVEEFAVDGTEPYRYAANLKTCAFDWKCERA